MSYILDALKKSEQERNLGKTPDISSNHEVLHRGIDYRNWILIAAVLLVVVLVAASGFFYVYLANQEQKQLQLVLEKKLHDAKLNELQMLKKQIQDERLAQSVNSSAEGNQTFEANDADDFSEEDAYDNELDDNGLEIIKPSQERREQLQQQIKQQAAKNESLKKEYEPLFEDETSADNAQAEIKSVEEVELPLDEQEQELLWEDYPSIAELDDSTKSQIPSLKVSTHIYSSVASYKKVTVNDKVLREGESVNENLVIEHILEDGVIFKFNDISFRMKVLEEWQGN